MTQSARSSSMSMVSFSDLPTQMAEHDFGAHGAGAATAAAKAMAARIALPWPPRTRAFELVKRIGAEVDTSWPSIILTAFLTAFLCGVGAMCVGLIRGR